MELSGRRWWEKHICLKADEKKHREESAAGIFIWVMRLWGLQYELKSRLIPHSHKSVRDATRWSLQMKHHSCISAEQSLNSLLLSQYETVIRITTSKHQATAKLCSKRSVSPANASWTFRKTRLGEKPEVFHHSVNQTWFCWRLNLRQHRHLQPNCFQY